MNTQNERELEKEIDDDFDFFKQNKSSAPKENKAANVSLEKNIVTSNNIEVNNNNEYKKIFFISTVMLMVIFLIFYSKIINVHPNEGKVKIFVPLINEPPKQINLEAKQTNNPEQPFNVDYSKLSKDDAERVKYALDQFADIQKTLIETNKPINLQK